MRECLLRYEVQGLDPQGLTILPTGTHSWRVRAFAVYHGADINGLFSCMESAEACVGQLERLTARTHVGFIYLINEVEVPVDYDPNQKQET